MYPKNEAMKNKIKIIPYAYAARNLMYTMIRPYICHAMELVTFYQLYPSKEHWQVIKKNNYLKGRIKLNLCFGLKGLEIIGYFDVDFTTSKIIRSQQIDVFLFGGTVVSYARKRHKILLQSI